MDVNIPVYKVKLSYMNRNRYLYLIFIIIVVALLSACAGGGVATQSWPGLMVDVESGTASVSYTHLTLPTSDLV